MINIIYNLTINIQNQDLINSKINLYILDNEIWVKNMDQVYKNGKMVNFIKVNGRMIIWWDMEE